MSSFVFHTPTESAKDEKKGLIKYYVESVQIGTSLFTKERKTDKVKHLLNAYLDKYMSDVIDRTELYLDQNTAWLLNVDVHIPGELSLNQLQHISIAVVAAFKNLRFPQVVVTQDQVTGSVEVDLLENVVDAPGSDKLVKISTKNSPLLILVGICGQDIVFDCNYDECLCIDTTLLVAVNKYGSVLGVETIGPAAKVEALKTAIEKVATSSKDMFTF